MSPCLYYLCLHCVSSYGGSVYGPEADTRLSYRLLEIGSGNIYDGVVFPACDGGLNDLLDRQAILAAGLDLIARHAARHLLQPAADARLEGLPEASHAAHDAVADHGHLHAVAGIERQLLEAVVEHKAAFRAQHLAPLQVVRRVGVVGAGQVADDVVGEQNVDLDVAPADPLAAGAVRLRRVIE